MKCFFLLLLLSALNFQPMPKKKIKKRKSFVCLFSHDGQDVMLIKAVIQLKRRSPLCQLYKWNVKEECFYLHVRVENDVEDDPFDCRQCRVCSSTEHVGQHVIQLSDGERSSRFIGTTSTRHFNEVSLDHVRISMTRFFTFQRPPPHPKKK